MRPFYGSVERANRTHAEEFHRVTDAAPDLASLRVGLLDWEATYNTVRPHQALGYLTPAESLASVRIHVQRRSWTSTPLARSGVVLYGFANRKEVMCSDRQ